MSVLQADDVIIEAVSSLSASEGEEDFEEAGDSENDIRELKARRHALANELAQQQKRRDKIQVKWTNLLKAFRFPAFVINKIQQELILIGECVGKLLSSLTIFHVLVYMNPVGKLSFIEVWCVCSRPCCKLVGSWNWK